MSLSPELQDAAHASGAKAAGRRGWIFIVGILAAVAVVGWVAISSFDSQIYYYTVAEASPRVQSLQGSTFRLKGNVRPDSHFVREGTLDEHRFTLVDGVTAMTVLYDGPLPDTFSDDAEVVALGQVNDQGEFVATEITAKCPSRYEGGAPTAER